MSRLHASSLGPQLITYFIYDRRDKPCTTTTGQPTGRPRRLADDDEVRRLWLLESTSPVGTAELVARGNRIEYRRPWAAVTEWYVNKTEGLEQGFAIEEPPGAEAMGSG